MPNIEWRYFKDIDLNDIFFDSLKGDYKEFDNWYERKSSEEERAFTLYEEGKLLAFLYLKIEFKTDGGIVPSLKMKKRLKIGTFKIDAHGTKLGERFIKKIFDIAVFKNIDEIYVTIFQKHTGLINILETFGFCKHGTKTTSNGTELVFVKNISNIKNDIFKDYPIIQTANKNKFVLSIYPEYHTRLFSDSILKNENVNILQDTSYTNSIHKIYICGMQGVQNFHHGDLVLIYRTSDGQGSARYRSVITSICIVEEVVDMHHFSGEDEYLRYCEPYSIFTEAELRGFYKTKKYPYIIKMTYNIAFKKRVTNGQLQDKFGISPKYWGVFDVTDEQFKNIIRAGEVDESLIVD